MQGDDIFFADQNLAPEAGEQFSKNEVMFKFKSFLKEWSRNDEYIYRKQLIDNGGLGNYYITIDLADLEAYDLGLTEKLREQPMAHLANIEYSAAELYATYNTEFDPQETSFQVQIVSRENSIALRELKSQMINKLINVNGIIINAGKTLLKGTKVKLKCRTCGHELVQVITKGLNELKMPYFCEAKAGQSTKKEKCPRDPYVTVPQESEFTDFQILKIQESPDSIPTGEIPRTYRLVVERFLADQMIPGTRVTLTGIYTILERSTISNTKQTAGLKMPYIVGLGFQTEQSGSSRILPNFTNADKERYANYSRDPLIYEKISKSIASTIFGHPDIKKSLACLLFSGATKILPDHTKLRGDINVLLLGDPSTAKSQFLKFIQKVAPISVYTSGKGSSAAGLTAAIIKDPNTNEFQLEGGALVLADGGVVCIDEFDKMRTQDRVAIHEAMEQQTISVAKAGITTILNARASVLAAANPIFGSYDDFKKISDQIDLQTTILSRFDCIFIVRDIRNMEHDKRMARHIVGLHTKGKGQMEEEKADFDLNELRNYILYAKMHVNPRLNQEAAITLQNLYVEDRKKASQAKQSNMRQLEAIIRLSESIAKMRLSSIVTRADVEEVSTMNAIKSGLTQGLNTGEEVDTVRRVEEAIKRMVRVNQKTNHRNLVEELEVTYQNTRVIESAILNLIRREEFKSIGEGARYLQRVK